MQLTLASSDTLDPCVIKRWVPRISAVLEPSTAASATAAFAKFKGGTTPGTAPYGGHTRRRRSFCENMGVIVTQATVTAMISNQVVALDRSSEWCV